MNLQIQNQGQPLDPSSLKSTGASNASASQTAGANTAAPAVEDKASISALTSQLGGGNEIRQERVDALRSQIESGTYTVNAHAVATAMFQNLFRS